MKNFYLVKSLLFVTLFFASIHAQNFKQVTDYSYPAMSDMYFINASTGWFVGTFGDVRKTTDGGNTWIKLPKPSLTDFDTLKAVFFLDQNIGFVGKNGNKIFKTTDGGMNWTVININGGISPLVNIWFHDVNKGWILTSSSSAAKVLSTTDGGTTWNTDINHTTGDLEDMAFFGQSSGIVVGGGVGKLDIYYTTNGTIWTKAPAPTLPPGYTRTDVRGVYMVNSNLAYAVGWGSLVGAQPSIHLKTTDGGATWQYITQVDSNRTYDNLNAVYFKDSNNGIAVGSAGRETIVVRTSDAGQNWKQIDIACGDALSTLNGFGDELITSGGGGIIFKTTNFGNTWQLLTPIPNENVYSIAAVTDNLIFGGGFNSIFFKSTNGGNNWVCSFVKAEGMSSNIQSIYFVNSDIGYAAFSYGMVAKTSDGGSTWKQVIPVTTSATATLYSTFFLNQNYGFVVGKESNNVDVIYKTTDGGVSWDKKTNLFATNLRAVAFKDLNNGIVVGEKLKAAYTTDGGTTWTPSVFNSLPPGTTTPTLFRVTYSSGNNTVAVGDKLILLSSDGGATWNYSPVTNLVESINSVKFINPNNGWAVGSKTTVPRSVGLYFTSNGGTTWSNEASLAVFDTMRALQDVSISPSGYAWIGGGSSAIYTNSPLVGINDKMENLNSFSLYQNYPNPFNPTTKIQWSVSTAGFQSLRVFDILGREIATIVNEYKPAGSYEVEFDASRLTSGVYFYQLKSGNYFDVKKMVLLR
jgi:photosystem II stability/assembly factor-like uncharacterized protein